MASVDPGLGAQLTSYLRHRFPEWHDLTAQISARIHGGASRETYRARITYIAGGRTIDRGIILRRDPVGSLIETDRAVEFHAYQAFWGTDVPVPEPICLELDPQWLDRPFFIMAEVEQCTAGSPFGPVPYGDHAALVGLQFWSILGRIAAAGIDAGGLSITLKLHPEPWREALDYWEGVIDADELEPHPVLRAAIRRLRRTPPPPPIKPAIVHGDYRRGNFLFDTTGQIRAILDWEMCHLGDPYEDLGWALDPIWGQMSSEVPGGMIDRDQALRTWTNSSGLTLDPQALAWWELFAQVKGMAIWISSGKEFVDGKNKDPVLAISSWTCTDRHTRLMAARLSTCRGLPL
jgi:aminoglycoside phosphotransferase (APT) family kinase protein